MSQQDALTIPTLEIVHMIHNPCAPIRHYACRCRTCRTQWLATEVFDEDGVRTSEWSWETSTAEF